MEPIREDVMICPKCKKDLVLVESADVFYTWDDSIKKFTISRVKGISGVMCDWCAFDDWDDDVIVSIQGIR